MNNCFIKILGCGGSLGCPLIGCKCKVCISQNTKNCRSRTSLYIRYKNNNIVIDTGPDLRSQMLREKINHIDYVLYTHQHKDHINGMDDLRSSFIYKNSPIRIFGNFTTIEACLTNFQYLFEGVSYKNQNDSSFFQNSDEALQKPIQATIVDDYDRFDIEGLKIKNFLQHHGKILSLGFLFEDYRFAYSTDFSELPEKTIEILKNANLDLWIVSLTLKYGNNAHASFEKIQNYAKTIKPKKIIFTHMSHDIDCDDRSYLDENMDFGYDGMEFDLPMIVDH